MRKHFKLTINGKGFSPAAIVTAVDQVIQRWSDERHRAKLPCIDGDRCVGYAASPRDAEGKAYPRPGTVIISFSGRTHASDQEIELGLAEVAKRIAERLGSLGEKWEGSYSFRGEYEHPWSHVVFRARVA